MFAARNEPVCQGLEHFFAALGNMRISAVIVKWQAIKYPIVLGLHGYALQCAV